MHLIKNTAEQIAQTMNRVIALIPDMELDEATAALYSELLLNEVEHAQMLVLNLSRLVVPPEGTDATDDEKPSEGV